MSSKPFPVLPDDIERLILELLAREDRTIALQLVRLARHIRPWIESEIYHSITLTPKRAEQFVWTIRNSGKPASWFHDHVKALSLLDCGSNPYYGPVLSVCTGLNSLAIPKYVLEEHQIPQNLRQLSIVLKPPLGPVFGECHHSLTHLELELLETLDASDATFLSCLPSLQYLHLDGSSGFTTKDNLSPISEFLASEVFNSLTTHVSPTVRAIVLGYDDCPGQNEPMVDERVIIAAFGDATGHRWVLNENRVTHPWGHIAAIHKRLPTIWEQAETILQNRREYYAKNHGEQRFLMYPGT